VQATASGFVTFSKPGVNLSAGQANPLDISLQIAAAVQEVDVSAGGAGQVSTDPSSNAGALVLKNEDLDQLPDDPDDLQSDLAALAGPAAGPNGAQFFVDGFSGGQLPPKSSIREIRINSNPFSSEFDRPGFGRIEIFTKPGTDRLRGQAFYNMGDSILDTRNPLILGSQPAYSSKLFGGNLSGPLSKKASFFLDFNRRQIDEGSLVDARYLNGALQEVPFNGVFPTPQRFWLISPRIDYQLNANNTLVVRYNHTANSTVGGVGQFALPTQETTQEQKNNTVQATETIIIGTKAVDETRFQFFDSHVNQVAVGDFSISGLNVSSSFNSGGAPFSLNFNDTKTYELQNILTITEGKHAIKVGRPAAAKRPVEPDQHQFQRHLYVRAARAADVRDLVLIGLHQSDLARSLSADPDPDQPGCPDEPDSGGRLRADSVLTQQRDSADHGAATRPWPVCAGRLADTAESDDQPRSAL